MLVALRPTVMLEAGGADTYTSRAIPGSEPDGGLSVALDAETIGLLRQGSALQLR
jgi:hypothetical protein